MKKHTQEQGEYWANSVDGNGELEVNHEEKDDESEDWGLRKDRRRESGLSPAHG